MSGRDPGPTTTKAPKPVVRSFVEDPVIRIIGFLLIAAAAALLYLSPESAVPLRWRGGPVPDSWERVTIAERVSIALPPDMKRAEVDAATYATDALALGVFAGDAAYPVRRIGAAMDDFRATTLPIDGRPARIALWTLSEPARLPHQLGVSFSDVRLTLVFSAVTEDNLQDALTAMHSVAFDE